MTTQPEPFWQKLPYLAEHLYMKGALTGQTIFNKKKINHIKHLAALLTDSFFPEYQLLRKPQLAINIDIATGTFSTSSVDGQEEQSILCDATLAQLLASINITTMHLDTLLEADQITKVFTLLFHARNNLTDTNCSNRSRIFNARSLAGAITRKSGLNKFCAHIQLNSNEKTVTIRYSYCELFYSFTINTFLERYTKTKNHQAFFSLAPKLGFSVTLLFVLHHLVWAPHSSTGLLIALLGGSALGMASTYLTSTIGSVLYDQEHRDKLLQENIKEITALSHIPAHNPNPILKLAESGELLFANHATELQRKVMGFPSPQILSILPDNFRQLTKQALNDQREILDIEVNKKGHVLRFNISPFRQERAVLFSGTDITRLKELECELRDLNKTLEAKVLARTEELASTQDTTILCLSSLAETRDPETGAHIQRTRMYIKILAQYLRNNPRFQSELHDKAIDLLFRSAPLHDIGKVGIPDAILLKPGPLTTEEQVIMETHPTIGGNALKWGVEKLGKNSFLKLAQEIAYGHHEKWDGSGYPHGLIEREIPLSCRLMAVADVYDALVNKRVYKKAFSHNKSKQIMLEKSGTHFDPDIIDAFLALEGQFITIAEEFSDNG